MCITNNLRFVMDETSVPYEKNENPFPRKEDDEEFDKKMIDKYRLITKEMENN